MSRIIQLGSLVLFLMDTTLLGHDFWIEPSTFRPTPGTPFPIHLKVGENFRGEALRRTSTHIGRFFIAGPKGVQEVRGVEGMNPAGYAVIEELGLHAIGYESSSQFIEVEPAKFENYLKEEGLEQISLLRAKRGESQKKGREVYSRCAKSLIWAGPASGAEGDRVLDLPLELTAQENPYLLRSGDELIVRLTFRGKPVENALITAILKDQDLRVSSRSDPEGRVRFPLSRPGVWLVKSVYMTPGRSETRADWESFWASLTFELAE